ncbi:nucleotide sugar dehydrogenase [Sediminibacterium sp.]|uniref:nucleotide sugar dehydrogenase n=1 Tax=Sediminibacterium sp. TaxID=1917865 RepID=UPI002735B04C|nr:nucleotide sugar dehydrogenase [Sediminibacterium sp.]MDP3392403.1 nucleotide sugar dehydrogenase [Sediminibacterium sp.]MDP3565669.1 nucleotide sugar dehydrogenase [Sediminibacterium sp.]
MNDFFIENKIAVIGLGYVGLPLAVEFGKKFEVLGFDINKNRIDELKSGIDRTLESNFDEIKSAKFLNFSNDIVELRNYNRFIVTVPTPIDKFNAPDLLPLIKASEMIGQVLKKNDIVIYESTVYPGCTEEDCVPVLEKVSGLKYNIDFFCGYSPERINPGDKINTLTKIKKVTSGSTVEVAKLVDELYKSIIKAGTHLAPSLKVAEASKAIENAQRDLNISFVNELALIFDKLGIDTTDVIEAAGTKWNFLKYRPGLVGGHCIGVDPYYLAHKSEAMGYHPEVILSGRRVNNNMGLFIANKVVKLMIQNGIVIKGANVLVLGVTFKENCPDIRNSKVVDIYNELVQFGLEVDVYDPHANQNEVYDEYGIKITQKMIAYEAIILAVSHNEFLALDYNKLKLNSKSIIYDIKAFLPRDLVNARL